MSESDRLNQIETVNAIQDANIDKDLTRFLVESVDRYDVTFLESLKAILRLPATSWIDPPDLREEWQDITDDVALSQDKVFFTNAGQPSNKETAGVFASIAFSLPLQQCDAIFCPESSQFTPALCRPSLGMDMYPIDVKGLFVTWKEFKDVFDSSGQDVVTVSWCVDNLSSPSVRFLGGHLNPFSIPPGECFAILSFSPSYYVGVPRHNDETDKVLTEMHDHLQRFPHWFTHHTFYLQTYEYVESNCADDEDPALTLTEWKK